MDLIIQHEDYQELLDTRTGVRDVEADAFEADRIDEKVFE
jgi:hypothetical protein